MSAADAPLPADDKTAQSAVASGPEPAAAAAAAQAAPSPEPAEAAGAATSVQARAEFRDISNSTVTIKQEFNLKEDFLESNLPGRVSMFFWREAELEISRFAEQESCSHFIYDETFVESTLAILNRHRVLLLTGEADCGKESMARYLAGRLREDGTPRRDTIVYGPQGRDVRLNLRSTLVREDGLHGRVVIFRDAVERENPGMVDFLCLLKGEAIASVTSDLEGIGSYLILTAVSSSLPPQCAATLPAWLRPAVAPLTPELLAKGVQQHIARFLASSHDPAVAGAVVSLELRQEIVERSGAMPRAARFIESHLLQVLRGEKTIASAFDEMDSLASWFQRGADSNLEAWLFCLALVLSDPLNRKEGVPWSEFFIIHDALRRHVLRCRKVKTTERPFDEAALHALAGVEVKRDPSAARDLIAFKDRAVAERLWSVLLSNFRSLLMEMAPALLELAEHDNPMVRSKAAQALGRIGCLDAGAMSGQWMARWARSEAWWERSLAGYLAQGALSANDGEYRRFILKLLDRYAQNRKQTWAAIAAYKQIGTIDLALGMDKLKEIAKSRLAPAFEASREIRQKLEQLDRDIAASRLLDADAAHAVVASLGSFYESLFKEDGEIARTFKYTLVSLSMIPGLTPVLAHLTRWALGTPGMGALVAVVFLQKDGIADVLTDRKLALVLNEGSSGEHTSCNMILASLIGDPDAIEIFARFMQTMFTAILDFFPPDTSALLTRLFFDDCKKWTLEALPIPPGRDAMVEIIGRFLQSPLKELYERTYDWLASDQDFLKPEMAAFAKSARLFKIKAR